MQKRLPCDTSARQLRHCMPHPIFREDQSIAEAIVDRVGNDAVPLSVEQRAKNNGNWKSYSSHVRCRKTNGDEDAEVAPEQFVSIRGEMPSLPGHRSLAGNETEGESPLLDGECSSRTTFWSDQPLRAGLSCFWG